MLSPLARIRAAETGPKLGPNTKYRPPGLWEQSAPSLRYAAIVKVGALDLPEPALRDFCRKWQITEFALFGSILRDDFGPESDIDVLVTFAPGAP